MVRKYEQLANRLRMELPQRRSGEQLPTERELSAKHHVSRQTVRKALELLAQEGLVSSRQGSGTYVTSFEAPPVLRRAAVITSFVDDYIFPTVLHDIQDVLSACHCMALVHATENRTDRERQILLRLLDEGIDALLVEGSKTALPNPNLDLYERFTEQGVPMVFLHSSYPGLKNPVCVADDNFGGGQELAVHLIQKGHTAIAGIFKIDDIQGHERYHGCVSAMRDHGLEIADQNFLWYTTEDRSRLIVKKDPRLLRQFIGSVFPHCTAVICYNDEIAYYLIRELLAMDFHVPQDVAVVSFDNSYISDLSPVRITSLTHRPKRMGQLAAEKLAALLSGQEAHSEQSRWSLVVKQSS